jgi:hypothetical protein
MLVRRKRWTGMIAVVAMAAAMLSSAAVAQLKTEVVTVRVRPGVTMKYLEIRGSERPSAVVLLFAGGNGVLALQPSGKIGTDLALNFLIRSRELFVPEGLAVAALDAATDLQRGMNGDVRLSAQHADDVSQVIAALKERIGAPVWLIGTSSGTISAAGVAARLDQTDSRPDGVVLTSTQTTLVAGLCGRTVYFAKLAAIHTPVLVVSHKDDACPCSPGSAKAGAKLMAALSAASAKEHKIFAGGAPPLSKGPCSAREPHGFFGIEGTVIKAIAEWIKKG